MAELNIAAWMLQEQSKITILPAPMPEPGPEEIIVKVKPWNLSLSTNSELYVE
jgi:hypothetical protein